MTDETKERLDQVIFAVFASPAGDHCQDCIIKTVIRECRTEGVRVSRLNIESRVKALVKASWEVEPERVN